MTDTQETYQGYLQSDAWKILRAQRLTMDDNQCILCGETASQAHHRRHPKEWGAETVKDLVSLCAGCYSWHHEKTRLREESRDREEDPTEKQLAYAANLGIDIPPGATRMEASDLIAAGRRAKRREYETKIERRDTRSVFGDLPGIEDVEAEFYQES